MGVLDEGLSKGCPLLTEQESTPVVSNIVARVRPRTSKGITDLLLLSVSDGFRTVYPSKKNSSRPLKAGGLGVQAKKTLHKESTPGVNTQAQRDHRVDTAQGEPNPTQQPSKEKSMQLRTHRSRSNRLVSRGESCLLYTSPSPRDS